MELFHVDAFTDALFRGNPAGVVLLRGAGPDEKRMQAIAAELRHSETAFVTLAGDAIGIRWFTPVREVDLCGHATLAAAHVLWETGTVDAAREIAFSSRSGVLTARREADTGLIALDFPRLTVDECEPNPLVNRAFGIAPGYTGKNDRRYLIEIDDPRRLRTLTPDFALLAGADRGAFIITCRSDREGIDFLSRFFAPIVGVPEDPVTGSAHCYLAPYWARKLGKDALVGFQESERTGTVACVLAPGDRVALKGRAVTFYAARMADGAAGHRNSVLDA